MLIFGCHLKNLALLTLTQRQFSLYYVGKLTKPKVQRNPVASKPVVPSDLSFLWVGFLLCRLPLLTFPEFVVAWRADTFSLLRQSLSTSCRTGSRAAFLLHWPPSISSSLHTQERIHEPTSRAMNFSGTVCLDGVCACVSSVSVCSI